LEFSLQVLDSGFVLPPRSFVSLDRRFGFSRTALVPASFCSMAATRWQSGYFFF